MALELIKISDFPQVNEPSEWIAVADANGIGYKISKADFKDWLGTVQTIVPKAISPTDPAPVIPGIYRPTTSGTYTNLGGLVIDVDGKLNEVLYDGSTFVNVVTPLPQATQNIPDWIGATPAGEQRLHNGQLWTASVATLEGEEPGVSDKWVGEIDLDSVTPTNTFGVESPITGSQSSIRSYIFDTSLAKGRLNSVNVFALTEGVLRIKRFKKSIDGLSFVFLEERSLSLTVGQNIKDLALPMVFDKDDFIGFYSTSAIANTPSPGFSPYFFTDLFVDINEDTALSLLTYASPGLNIQIGFDFYDDGWYEGLSDRITELDLRKLDSIDTTNIYRQSDIVNDIYWRENTKILTPFIGFQVALVEVQKNKSYSIWHSKISRYISIPALSGLGFVDSNRVALKDIDGVSIGTNYGNLPISDSGVGRVITVPEVYSSAGVVYDGIIYLAINVNFESNAAYPNTNVSNELTIELGTYSNGFVPETSFTKQPIVYKNDDKYNSIRTNEYFGKLVATFGDSISTENWAGGYVKYLQDILGCVLTKKALSGIDTRHLVGYVADIWTRGILEPGSGSYTPLDFTLYKAVTIMIGTNTGDSRDGTIDTIPYVYGQSVDKLPFDVGGVTVSTPTEYWELFPNTYWGNLAICLEYIKWKSPATKIFLITPPKNTRLPIGYIEETRTMMIEIASLYSVPIIDVQNETNIDKKYIMNYTGDGTHPNELGNKIIGTFIANKIFVT